MDKLDYIPRIPERRKEEQHVKPRCWVVCRYLGVPSEVWLHRQITGLQRFRPEIICWEYQNKDQFPLGGIPVNIMPFDPLPDDGPARWLRRSLNAFSGNYYGTLGKEAAALRDLMVTSRPSVILAQFGHMALRVLPIGLKAGVPVVAHFHGVDITAALGHRWYKASLRKALPRFAAAIVVADYQRNTLIKLGAAPEKVHVIPCGVPVENLPAAADVGKQACAFLTVGRFVEKKAPLEVVRAFAACLKKVGNVSLTMVGEGPMLQAARDLAGELNISPNVRFTGSLPSATVMEEMLQASVFVQHSVTSSSGDMEGWPVSIAEAMAVGLPVISTRHAGIPQQVIEGESGFMVEEKDWQAMADRMDTLALAPELRTKMGNRSLKIAQKNFSQKRMIHQLEDILIQHANQ